MSPSQLMQAMADAGAPMDAIIIAMRALEERDAVLAEQRAAARDRKRRQREKERDSHVTVTGQSQDSHAETSLSLPPNEINSNPPTHTHPEEIPRARKADPFPRPDWADPQVWSDWMDVRKTKRGRNTATAYAGFLADIDKLTNAEWPPGRLLAHAVAQSWAGIYEPKEGYPSSERHSRPARISSPTDNRGTRPSPLVDILAGIAAEERAEGNAEDHLGTWPPLRAIGSIG